MTLGDLLEREAAYQPVTEDGLMALVMDPFPDRLPYLAVSVFDHFARTRPLPPQVPQVLYWGPLVFFEERFGF